MSVDARTRTDVGNDESIQSMMQADFKRSNYPALHDVRCQFDRGVLCLQGSVPSFHLKQMAFAVVRRRLADVRIDDRLRVTGS